MDILTACGRFCLLPSSWQSALLFYLGGNIMYVLLFAHQDGMNLNFFDIDPSPRLLLEDFFPC